MADTHDSRPSPTLDLTLRLTPRMRNKMLAAERHARTFGHDYIGTEHVLLAFLDDADGIAGSLLAQDDRAKSMRATLLAIMAEATPQKTPGEASI